MTAAPDGYVQNLRVYGPSEQSDFDRSPSDLVTMLWGTSTSGITPVSTVSVVATGIQHSQYNSVGTALAIPITTGNSKLDAIGEKSGYFVSQMKVEYGAQQGALPTQIWSLVYEEV
jgi:hypothetical protein